MKIVGLYMERFKRIRCVEITPDGPVVQIKGKNTQGKSSVLDGIWAALEWRAAKKQVSNPINRDSDDAVVELDLGEYKVRRTFAEGDDGVITRLKVTAANGDTVSKPQTVLENLLGDSDLSFDLHAFSRMKEAEQRRVIAEIAGVDLDDADAKRRAAFEERSGVNREIKRLKGALSSIRPPTDGEPAVENSSANLISELQERQKAESDLNALLDHENRVASEITRLEQRLAELREEQLKISQDQKPVQDRLSGLRLLPDIQSDIDNLDKRNARAREVQKYFETKKSLEEFEAEAKKLSAAMGLIDIQIEEAVENCDLPIDGLKIDAEGISINGAGWDELSQAEKIRYSMVIAMALNPELRIIRITDGSLLDSDTLEIVSELADKNDYQVWIEMVADGPDGVGVFLEDGEVRHG